MVEDCKWRFAEVDGVRKDIVNAVSGERGVCPLCGARMVARKGEVRQPHWSHFGTRQCDDWYQPKGPWHLYWQNKFPKEWQEVVVEGEIGGKKIKHIADIRTDSKAIVEVQWSPITAEEILQRESFYKNMLWIAGMNRVEADKRIADLIEESSFRDIREMRIWKIGVGRLKPAQKRWFNCSRPVFMDFGATPDRLDSVEDLYYVFPPKEDQAHRFCVRVPRDHLIESLKNGRLATRDFFQGLKCLRMEYERLDRIDYELQERERRRFEQAEKAAREAELVNQKNREYEEAKPYVSFANSVEHAIAFANHKFHYPPRCALTVGWIDAYLIVEELYNHLVLDSNQVSIAPYGRVALHQAKNYSLQEYEADCMRTWQKEVNVNLPQYQELAVYADKIIACVDYLVKRTEEGIVLTFRSPAWILKPDGKAYVWNKNARGFWHLPEKTQEYLGNVDEDSRFRLGL